MLSGDQGAAAVLGSTSISYEESEELLGKLLTPRLRNYGWTIGSALQAAKADIARLHPEYKDILLGWTILGDPTLQVLP